MVSFFTAGSWEKDTIFGAAETNFRPFLFCDRFKIVFFKFSLPKRVELMSEVIEEDMDEEDVKEEFRWWRPRISQKLIE